MYEDNEMILTEENIEKAAKFIGADGYNKTGRSVTFFNVPTKTFNESRTHSICSDIADDIFEYVSIKVGNFIFTK